MRRYLVPLLTALLTVVVLFASHSVADAQEPAESAPAAPEGAPALEHPYCYQPDPAQNTCYINFRELNVTHAEVRKVVLGIGDEGGESRSVAIYTETPTSNTIYATAEMNGPGFPVACGEETEDTPYDIGASYFLNVYPLSVNNSDLGGTGASVDCPAYVPGVPTAIGANSFTATLDRLAPYQGLIVALVVGVGLLVNVLVPARLRQWRKRTQ